MPTGFITKIIAEKKIGFIASRDGGRDVFFHSSVVAGDQFDKLEEGQTVSFDLDETQGTNERPRAAKVEPSDEKRPTGSKGADPQVARHPRARRRKPTWRD
ncbi:MAG: cold shock domain-containing protein [Planctomycetes bacterium]|nr:cold shock domain-containing protein [Planctomycetota bacterium]MBL7042299.1 cold shock domain-containing protein [Pirellulaceae bacterium]